MVVEGWWGKDGDGRVVMEGWWQEEGVEGDGVLNDEASGCIFTTSSRD